MKISRRKRIGFILAALILSLLCSCGQGSSNKESVGTDDKKTVQKEENETKTLKVDEFDSLLSELPVTVVSTKYIVQDDKYKSLYPDLLQAVIQNNTQLDIKNAVVAFAAWDGNNLPVKIQGSMDFEDGEYIQNVNYSDINLVPGGKYGESGGFELAENNNISSFKAIVVSYEAFDGTTWENPYFDEFTKLYQGVKFDPSMTVDVKIEDVSEKTAENSTQTTAIETQKNADTVSMEELDKIIATQDIAVVSTKYFVQDEKYKSLYPDMLQAVIQNNTKLDIKNAVVAFAAWDSNNLPIKIQGSMDFEDGVYIKNVNYSDINLVPGDKYGESGGFELAENNNISSFKAIVVSYEAFDGTTWENPYYKDFVSLYEGQKMS